MIEQILSLTNFLQENHLEIDQLTTNAGQSSPTIFSNVPSLCAAYEMVKFIDEMPGGFLIYRACAGEEIIYANRALLRIFQCATMAEFRELTHNSFAGMVHPEDLEAVHSSIQEQVSASQYDLDYVEYRIIQKGGTVRWIEDYGHFVRDKSAGNYFYVFLVDATEKQQRQQAEKAQLIQSYNAERGLIDQEHLRRLEVIEGLSVNYESILYADLEQDTIRPYRLSTRTQLQFGEKFHVRSFSWYVADYVRVWVHPEDQAMVGEAISPAYVRQKLAESDTYYINYRAVENGETKYLQLRLVNVGSSRQPSQAVLGYRRMDMEIQHELEQKQLLATALNNANLAITAKNAFLSNMSHDMRTPLNAIFGFTARAKKHLSGASEDDQE